MSSFVTHRTPPPQLVKFIENRERPWEFSPPIEKRLQKGSGSFRSCQLLPSDKEWPFVWGLFHFQHPTLYVIKRIVVIDNPDHLNQFIGNLKDTEKNGKKLTPTWPKNGDSLQRKRISQRWEWLKKIFPPPQLDREAEPLEKTTVLPLWHAAPKEKGLSICDSGFIIPGKTTIDPKKLEDTSALGVPVDTGYFGSGIYFATGAGYPVDAYSKGGVVLLAWVSTRMPLPTLKEDKGLEGKGAYEFFDAHFIPVKRIGNSLSQYGACSSNELPDSDELVVFQKGQTLVRFLVYLQPPLNPSNIQKPQNKEALIDLIYQALQFPRLRDDAELPHALHAKLCSLLVSQKDNQLTEMDRPFICHLKALLSQASTVDQLAKRRLLELPRLSVVAPKKVPEALESASNLIFLEKFDEALTTLLLLDPENITGHNSAQCLVYLLQKLIPHLKIEKKGELFKLFNRIVRNLPRRHLSFSERWGLEKHLIHWLSCSGEHEEALRQCALVFNNSDELSNEESVELDKAACKELASILLTEHDQFKEPLYAEIRTADKKRLGEIVSFLSFLRSSLFLEKEEREQLQPLFLLLAQAFVKDDTGQNKEVRALINKGIGSDEKEKSPHFFSTKYRLAALGAKRLSKFLEDDLVIDQKKMSLWLEEDRAKKILSLLVPEVLDFTHEHLEEDTVDRLLKTLDQTEVRKIIFSSEGITEPSIEKFKGLKNSGGVSVEISRLAPHECEDPGRILPLWRIIKPGVNIQGVCKNMQCRLYLKRAWKRIEVENSKETEISGKIRSILCANTSCKKEVVVDTVAFFKCYYQLESVVTLDGRRESIKKSVVPPLGEVSFFKEFYGDVHYLNVVVDLLYDGLTVHARCDANNCARKGESISTPLGYTESTYYGLMKRVKCLSPACNTRPTLEQLTLKNCSFFLEGKYKYSEGPDLRINISSHVYGQDLYPFSIKEQQWYFLNIIAKRVLQGK